MVPRTMRTDCLNSSIWSLQAAVLLQTDALTTQSTIPPLLALAALPVPAADVSEQTGMR